ncbi:hypothetical protein AB0J38_00100 [Streptomyces sp. NPDC050095]|uniref:hypothetical protein n=1 Tax=unclassified Streptomyces TaxID=2593676 RepID=UPI00341A6630
MTRKTRTALTLALATATALSVAGTSLADDGVPVTRQVDNWGTVLETPSPVQSNAWVVRVKGVGGILDTALFESHYPASAKAPKQQNGGNKIVDLAPGGFGIGRVSALFSRALGNEVPSSRAGGANVPAPGTAYADAGGGAVDVGLPYISNPKGGTQLSPFGVHVDGIMVSALSQPKKPVAFTGGAASGYISVLGQKVVSIPDVWASNLGARIPKDYSQDPVALATTNEQVTTDENGMPTLGKDGHYKMDPKATSGYVTGIHASVLGTQVADVTVAHAAVIRDAAKTDGLAKPIELPKPELPKPMPLPVLKPPVLPQG